MCLRLLRISADSSGSMPLSGNHNHRRVSYLEVDPVNSVTDILEHALIGHEEVAVLEASFTAAGEEQRDTQPSDRPHFYRRVSIFFCSFLFFLLFALIWDSLPLLEGSPAKEESNLPLKDQQPGFRGQRTCSHSRLHSQQIHWLLNFLMVELKRLNHNYIMITFIFLVRMILSFLTLISIHAFSN